MYTIKSFVHISAVAFMMAILPFGSAFAGKQTIKVPDGAKVEVNIKYKNGTTGLQSTGFKDNGPGDEDPALGSFAITLDNQSQIKTKEVKSLGVFGAAASTVFDFGLAGMDSFEPVDLFFFSSVNTGDIIVAKTDVESFLAGGNVVSPGDIFTAVNGTVPGLDGITFLNANSIYTFNSFFDVFVELSIYDTLPAFSGDVVSSLDSLQAVPEPSTLLLLGLSLAGLLGLKLKRKVAA